MYKAKTKIKVLDILAGTVAFSSGVYLETKGIMVGAVVSYLIAAANLVWASK